MDSPRNWDPLCAIWFVRLGAHMRLGRSDPLCALAQLEVWFLQAPLLPPGWARVHFRAVGCRERLRPFLV